MGLEEPISVPPGRPGTGSSLIPLSVTPSFSPSFPLAAWDLFHCGKTPRLKRLFLKTTSFVYYISRDPPLHHLPAPLDVEAMAMNDELVEGFLGGHLSSLPCSKLNEGALLPLHYSDGSNLPKLVEMVPGGKMQVGRPVTA